MKDKKLVPIIAAVVAVVAVIAIIFLIPNSAESAVSKYNKAYLKENAEKVYSLKPQLLLDAENDELEKNKKKDEADFIDDIADQIDDDFDDFKDDYNRKTQVIRARKVKKSIVEQYNEYLDKYSPTYKDIYDKEKHEVKKAYILEVRETTTNDEKKDTSLYQVIAVKENGKWKLLDSDYWGTEDYYFDWENENDFKDIEKAIKEYY